jgi:hypothetical protein
MVKNKKIRLKYSIIRFAPLILVAYFIIEAFAAFQQEDKNAVITRNRDYIKDITNAMADKLDDIFPNIYFYRRRVTSRFSHIWKDTDLSVGTVVTEPDKDGIFSYLDQYSKDENIAVVLKQKTNVGLYNKGIL